MKTRLDVINRAFRRLGIKSEDEALTADQIANGGEVLDALIEEIGALAPVPFTVDAVPHEAFIPLSNLLAVEIGPDYVVATQSRGAALMRVLGVIRPDDRVETEAEYY